MQLQYNQHTIQRASYTEGMFQRQAAEIPRGAASSSLPHRDLLERLWHVLPAILIAGDTQETLPGA